MLNFLPFYRHLPPDNSIHVAIVACGNRAPEAIISLKSFAMFSKRNLHFHVFAEEELHKEFQTKIQAWPRFIDGTVKLDIQKIQFPGSDDFNRWKSLFKPCASQRLFLPVSWFVCSCNCPDLILDPERGHVALNWSRSYTRWLFLLICVKFNMTWYKIE